MNSNTFSDAADQAHSYKFGSLSHADAATRQQAVDHNLECIAIGTALGSKALTVWIGDGSNFPGQVNFTRSFERYLDAMKAIYKGLPDDWKIFSEHKMFEPAFYSTVVQDWGTNYLIAQELGPKAHCLVDLGHHAPNVNIEMIVARLIQFKKLGGFHFNDSKYGDDDLDTGSIDPYRLVPRLQRTGGRRNAASGRFAPMHMLDQSHNVTDPIESLMNSATEVSRAYAQALLVDRKALEGYQDGNDALMATETLKAASAPMWNQSWPCPATRPAARFHRFLPTAPAVTAPRFPASARRQRAAAAGSSEPLSPVAMGGLTAQQTHTLPFHVCGERRIP